jgi:hypothetical protein
VREFYFLVWLKWALRLSACSLIGAGILSTLITFFFYMQAMVAIDREVYLALCDIFWFWFALSWSLTILIALFRSLKYLFNSCHNGYSFVLHGCSKNFDGEILDAIGYGDLIKVWRKWLMLIIWLVAILMIMAVVFVNIFTSYSAIFDWFSIYVLYVFILMAGYISFILLPARCKVTRIRKC